MLFQFKILKLRLNVLDALLLNKLSPIELEVETGGHHHITSDDYKREDGRRLTSV